MVRKQSSRSSCRKRLKLSETIWPANSWSSHAMVACDARHAGSCRPPGWERKGALRNQRLMQRPTRALSRYPRPLRPLHYHVHYFLPPYQHKSGPLGVLVRGMASRSAELLDASSWKEPLQGASPTVALGKFDALHRGHQKLVARAANLKPSSTPYLISFDGMADVLGWEPRLPLVAACDRPRVLGSWVKICAGVVPRELGIPFSQVRHLSPEEFVCLLAEDLGAVGVVVGSNYRFGYKAAGTAETLKVLGAAHGMKVEVVNLVERMNQIGLGDTVSSSAVREGLAAGNMAVVEECMGRPYRLVGLADVRDAQGFGTVDGVRVSSRWYLEAGGLMNQYPAAGSYDVNVGLLYEAVAGSALVGFGEECCGDVAFRPGRVVFDAQGSATVGILEEDDVGDMAALVSGRDGMLCVLDFVRPA